MLSTPGGSGPNWADAGGSVGGGAEGWAESGAESVDLATIASMTLLLTPACLSAMRPSGEASYAPGLALMVATMASSVSPALTILMTESLLSACWAVRNEVKARNKRATRPLRMETSSGESEPRSRIQDM